MGLEDSITVQSSRLATHLDGRQDARSHTAVFLNAGILAHPSEFVTREIPRICRGFFLVDGADQMEEMP